MNGIGKNAYVKTTISKNKQGTVFKSIKIYLKSFSVPSNALYRSRKQKTIFISFKSAEREREDRVRYY